MPQEGKADMQAALLTYPWMFLTSGSLPEGASYSAGGGGVSSQVNLPGNTLTEPPEACLLFNTRGNQVDNPTFTPRF